ncbi:unnamed protein product [Prorocentrum cordatum]|uniref:Uncharacterized protein n=1 Tax=Prorocentrum cordatum TaxID=2364126 RepID=A0ABN9SI48_9DINO|nr:unnamed protein product [Polarella glacialis]
MNREFTQEEITVARFVELSRLDEFRAKEDIDRSAAMVNFDARYREITIEQLNTRRLVSEPSACVCEDAKVVVTRHVDDGMVIGDGSGPDEFLEALGEHFLLRITPEMTRGSSQVHFGRIIRKLSHGMGFPVRVAPKTTYNLLEHRGVQNAKAVATPGLKSAAQQDGEELLTDGEARKFRAARYLGGAGEFANPIAPEAVGSIAIEVKVGSGWAGDELGRGSTSSGRVYLSDMAASAHSRTQAGPATPSTEADVYAAGPAGLQVVDRQALAEVAGLRSSVLRQRGTCPSWSWQRASACEAALFYDPLGDPEGWRPGPNRKSSGNRLAQEDGRGPCWLSGGTDWQAFQGAWRCLSKDGIRPAWVAFRVCVATPELSGAFLTLSASTHTWGLAEPVVAFSYRGDDAREGQRRCFSVQSGSTQKGDPVHVCHGPLVEVSASKTYDVAVHLDWDPRRPRSCRCTSTARWRSTACPSRPGPFAGGSGCEAWQAREELEAQSPIRHAAVFNWRSAARAAFSELMLGDECPHPVARRGLHRPAARESARGARGGASSGVLMALAAVLLAAALHWAGCAW